MVGEQKAIGLGNGLGTKSPTRSADFMQSTILDRFSANRFWNRNRVNVPSSRQLFRSSDAAYQDAWSHTVAL
jgi:hypothetical protein